jgi:CheY-like chemotaxis protein
MSKKRILIVEDLQVMRMLYTKYFEKMYRQAGGASFNQDLELLEASTGQAALEILGRLEGPLHLIILDVMMPQIDGYGFLEERQKLPRFADTPVILCSALSEQGVSEKTACLKVSAFLPKPFTFDGFVKVAGKFVDLA